MNCTVDLCSFLVIVICVTAFERARAYYVHACGIYSCVYSTNFIVCLHMCVCSCVCVRCVSAVCASLMCCTVVWCIA